MAHSPTPTLTSPTSTSTRPSPTVIIHLDRLHSTSPVAKSTSPTSAPTSTPTPTATLPPCPTGSDSSANSINDVANQRFNQMITNRVLGTVLLGINEQINCNDCVSAFGSAGSFSAGIHGRKNLTANLALLAGIAYTHYSEGGYSVTSAPIGAFALRYDFTDWGSSRPFFDIGTILTPYEKVRYRRSYTTSLGAGDGRRQDHRENYGVYGRAGWISRLSPRDEVAASVEVWQLWQRVRGYADPDAVAFNPFDATFNTGTDKTTLVKIGGQWTHLFGSNIETNINGGYVYAFGTQIRRGRHRDRRGHGGADDRQPGLVRIWRPARLSHQQGLDRRPLRQRHRRPAAGRQHRPWRHRAADHLLSAMKRRLLPRPACGEGRGEGLYREY